MTNKTRSILSKSVQLIAIVTFVFTLFATTIRAIDLSGRTAKAVDALTCRIEKESKERMEMDTLLTDQIREEREARKDEYTKIQVKLTEIDTTLIYIKQAVDNIQYPTIRNLKD